MLPIIRKPFRRLMSELRDLSGHQTRLRTELAEVQQTMAQITPGNPAVHGYKIYSQCDEDGIIEHIFGVLGDGYRTFVEIGCSDGLENNTHALLLKGWRGIWLDADAKKISTVRRQLPESSQLTVQCSFVTRSNAQTLLPELVKTLDVPSIDFLSVDIDGDDLGVVSCLIRGPIRPRVICVEYNAKFPPPMKVAVMPQRSTRWRGDDYQGASLSSLCDDLATHGYRLVACNATGANAFFVKCPADASFPTYPIELLYQPARYHLRRLNSGHPASLAFLADALLQASEKSAR